MRGSNTLQYMQPPQYVTCKSPTTATYSDTIHRREEICITTTGPDFPAHTVEISVFEIRIIHVDYLYSS